MLPDLLYPKRLQGASLTDEPAPRPTILPSISSLPAFNHTSPLTPVVCDDRAIAKLLETLLSRSGLSTAEICRRLGITTNALRQYLAGRRKRPSLSWFVRLVEICGGKVTITFPEKR